MIRPHPHHHLVLKRDTITELIRLLQEVPSGSKVLRIGPADIRPGSATMIEIFPYGMSRAEDNLRYATICLIEAYHPAILDPWAPLSSPLASVIMNAVAVLTDSIVVRCVDVDNRPVTEHNIKAVPANRRLDWFRQHVVGFCNDNPTAEKAAESHP